MEIRTSNPAVGISRVGSSSTLSINEVGHLECIVYNKAVSEGIASVAVTMRC